MVAARGPSSPSSEQYAPQHRPVDSPQALNNLRCFAQLQDIRPLSRMLPQAIADVLFELLDNEGQGTVHSARTIPYALLVLTSDYARHRASVLFYACDEVCTLTPQQAESCLSCLAEP